MLPHALATSRAVSELLVASAARARARVDVRRVARRTPERALPPELCRRGRSDLLSQGYTVVPGLLERQHCRELVAGRRSGAELAEHPDLVALARTYWGARRLIAHAEVRVSVPGSPPEAPFLWQRSHAPRELLAIAYLDGLDLSQGPIEVVPGSHRMRWVLQDLCRPGAATPSLSSVSLSILQEQDDARLRERYPRQQAHVVTAPAGTLVLLDPRALRRFGNVTKGERAIIQVTLRPE